MDALTGKTAKKQYNLAREAQDASQARLAKEAASVKAVEDGQRRAAQRGGGGMLAYIDEKLKQTFGN